jgi:hypothetical protein
VAGLSKKIHHELKHDQSLLPPRGPWADDENLIRQSELEKAFLQTHP